MQATAGETQQDMFGFAVEVSQERFCAIYASGASAYSDAVGFANAGHPTGVVATELRHRTVGLIRSLLCEGSRVFVDSGAFGAFQRATACGGNAEIDFEPVFAIYDRLLERLPAGAVANCAIVMSDVIGDQARSLALLERYREKVRGFIAAGADVIVPLQRGALSAAQLARAVTDMFGPTVRFGMPSKAAAMSNQEVARIRGARFHLLGMASMNRAMRQRAYTILEQNPDADISCDANLIRSHTTQICAAHRHALAASEGDVWHGEFDDTELVNAVLNQTGWMTRAQVSELAQAYGEGDQAASWWAAHQDAGLADLLDEHDPDGAFLYQYVIPRVFGESAQKRALAIKEVFAKLGPCEEA